MTTLSLDAILSLPAGRELDALVAEKVMGLSVEDYRYPMGWKRGKAHSWAEEDVVLWGNILCILNPDGTRKLLDDGFHVVVPYYSTSIAAAWELVIKLDKYVFAVSRSYRGWYGDFSLEETHIGLADTAPLAICRAALKAVMG